MMRPQVRLKQQLLLLLLFVYSLASSCSCQLTPEELATEIDLAQEKLFEVQQLLDFLRNQLNSIEHQRTSSSKQVQDDYYPRTSLIANETLPKEFPLNGHLLPEEYHIPHHHDFENLGQKAPSDPKTGVSAADVHDRIRISNGYSDRPSEAAAAAAGARTASENNNNPRREMELHNEEFVNSNQQHQHESIRNQFGDLSAKNEGQLKSEIDDHELPEVSFPNVGLREGVRSQEDDEEDYKIRFKDNQSFANQFKPAKMQPSEIPDRKEKMSFDDDESELNLIEQQHQMNNLELDSTNKPDGKNLQQQEMDEDDPILRGPIMNTFKRMSDSVQNVFIRKKDNNNNNNKQEEDEPHHQEDKRPIWKKSGHLEQRTPSGADIKHQELNFNPHQNPSRPSSSSSQSNYHSSHQHQKLAQHLNFEQVSSGRKDDNHEFRSNFIAADSNKAPTTSGKKGHSFKHQVRSWSSFSNKTPKGSHQESGYGAGQRFNPFGGQEAQSVQAARFGPMKEHSKRNKILNKLHLHRENKRKEEGSRFANLKDRIMSNSVINNIVEKAKTHVMPRVRSGWSQTRQASEMISNGLHGAMHKRSQRRQMDYYSYHKSHHQQVEANEQQRTPVQQMNNWRNKVRQPIASWTLPYSRTVPDMVGRLAQVPPVAAEERGKFFFKT